MRLPTRPSLQPARLVAPFGLAFLGACAARPGQPLLELASDHYAGSALAGPTLAAEWPAGAAACTVELRVAYVTRPPRAPAEPLAAAARQVLVDSGEPLQARGELAAGALRLDGGAGLEEEAWQARRLEAVLPGATAVFRLAPARDVADPPRTAFERLDLRLGCRADEVQIALVLEGLRREQWQLDPRPLADTRASCFFFPAPRAQAERGGFLVELRFAGQEATDELATALARARGNLIFSHELARRRSDELSPAEARLLERDSALRALHDPTQRHAALVFLADAAGAPATADLALAGDDATLLAYVDALDARLLEEAEAVRDGVEPAALGWLIESQTHAFLARLAGDDPALNLAPELRSLMLRHAGQLALFPDVVLELVAQLGRRGSVAELEARFVEENRLFLGDAHPAVRVRACEWLQRRGAAPAGYDPLGPQAERRAALIAGERAREAAAEEQP